MELKEIPCFKKFEVEHIGSKEVKRAMREDENTVFVFSKGKRRYGNRFSNECFFEMYRIKEKKEKSEKEKWQANVRKLSRSLATSGLWPNLLKMLINVQKIGLDNLKQIQQDYYNIKWADYKLPEPERTNENKKILNEKMGSWIDKFPFLIEDEKFQSRYIDDCVLDIKIKSMYFGKYRNDSYKAEIRDALENKRSCNVSTRASYDVRFSYDPEGKKAWYSEEYRGCGNGHYYLAIDDRLCWFMEND